MSNHFNICILSLLLHTNDITSHCIFFLLNTFLKMLKKGRKMEEVYHMFVYYLSNCSAVVGIYTVTCLTSGNMGDFKL
jgi:hypothetical protein